MKVGVFTIIAKNYLAFARVLMSSVRQHDPGFLRVVVVVDQIDGCFEPDREDFEVIGSEELDIPNSRWFHFKYSILELSTAVKPYAIEHLLRRYDLDQLVYLDPDIRTYGSLVPISGKLAQTSATLLLTPHLTDSLDFDHRPTDLDILRSGAYNLGFLAVSASPETTRFLKWWQAKLYDLCVVDIPRGLFVDQRWIDLVPSLFHGVVIDRSPGYNVAYWNIGHRKPYRAGEDWLVNGEPLYFFHFSGFNPDDPEEFSRHQNRFRTSELGEAAQLVRDYARELFDHGFRESRNWPYAYGRFANGVCIPDLGRPVHHEQPELLERLSDPFSEDGFRAFLEVWNDPLPTSGARSLVPRLAYRLYRTRTDVQAAMPDLFGGDLLRFLHWMITSGQREHALDEAFLRPVREAITAAASSATNPAAVSVSDSPESLIELQLRSEGLDPDGITNGGGVRLTRLAQAIYDRRPDLQRFFPHPHGENGVKFLLWLLTYGRLEYRLAPSHLAPLRREWDSVLDRLDSPWQRCWYTALLGGAKLWLGSQALARRTRNAINLGTRRLTAPVRERAQSPQSVGPVRGVNLIGYLRAEMGVGESARLATLALRAAGYAVATRTIPAAEYREKDPGPGKDAEQLEHPVSLFYVNADQTEPIAARFNGQLWGQRRKIGYWVWELETFPRIWDGAFAAYDEIWTPSSFSASAIAALSPVPVVVIPHCIEVLVPEHIAPLQFGIAEAEFVFLTAFDVRSVIERKNPAATIEAFRLAFDRNSGARLVVKINNAHAGADQIRKLRERAAGLPVTFIEETLDRRQMAALLDACDCLVSLHRSEGFGLLLAEAMFLGKPVIATAYSGNMDFTRPENSFLVGYRMCRVGAGCGPYDPQAEWADPDIDEAARQMRIVAECRDLRHQRAAAGRAFVTKYLSPAAVGQRIRNRLELFTGGEAPLKARAAAARAGR